MSYQTSRPDAAELSAVRLNDWLSEDRVIDADQRDATRHDRTRRIMHPIGLAVVVVSILGILQMAGVIGFAPAWVSTLGLVLVATAVAVVIYRAAFGSGSKRKGHAILVMVLITAIVMLAVHGIGSL